MKLLNQKPEIVEVDDMLRDVIKDCHEKLFHTIEKRCMYV